MRASLYDKCTTTLLKPGMSPIGLGSSIFKLIIEGQTSRWRRYVSNLTLSSTGAIAIVFGDDCANAASGRNRHKARPHFTVAHALLRAASALLPTPSSGAVMLEKQAGFIGFQSPLSPKP